MRAFRLESVALRGRAAWYWNNSDLVAYRPHFDAPIHWSTVGFAENAVDTSTCGSSRTAGVIDCSKECAANQDFA